MPVPRTQSSVHRFEPTDDPNIVRMTWMVSFRYVLLTSYRPGWGRLIVAEYVLSRQYSTRDGLEIKKIIGEYSYTIRL